MRISMPRSDSRLTTIESVLRTYGLSSRSDTKLKKSGVCSELSSFFCSARFFRYARRNRLHEPMNSG